MDTPDKLITTTDCARVAVGTIGLCATRIDPVQLADLITKYGGAVLVVCGVAQVLFKAIAWCVKKAKG